MLEFIICHCCPY